ncbi:MAG: MFS metabolite transporter [Porticoccaceae bacterium]|nr:MAG: MFS metabolite transporter [Porticoccaceae bacterium]
MLGRFGRAFYTKRPARSTAQPLADSAFPYTRLAAFYFWYYGLLGLTHPFWALFLAHRGFAPGEIGLMLAVQMGTRILSPNLWGWLADRSGKRLAVIRWGAFLGMASFAGIFLAEGFWGLLAVIAAYSFFWNAIMPQFEALTLEHLGSRAQRYGLVRLWGSVGFIVAVVGGGWWFELRLEDFRHLGFAVLALIWLSTLAVRDPDGGGRVARGTAFAASLRAHPVWAFLLVSFLLQASHGVYYSFFSLHLEEAGYSRSQIGALWALSVLSEIALFLVMHRLLTSWGLRELFCGSLFLAAVRWWLIGAFPGHAALLIAAQCLHAFSFGVCHALSMEYLRRFFPPECRGRGQALYSSVSFGAGGAAGSLLGGVLWEWGQALAFTVAGWLALLAAMLAWRYLDLKGMR